MAKITFITSDNDRVIAEATSGNIMELALQHKVKGIDGNCGGVCSCATCHVHVDNAFWEKAGQPSELESDMLEFDENVSEHSRLSCQIQVSEAIDGIILKVAK